MSEQKHWLDFAEIGSAAVSIAGAIATITGQSAAYATLPLSVSVTLNLLNRKRLLAEMLTHHNHEVATLQQSVDNSAVTLKGSLDQHITSAKQQLNQLTQNSQHNLEKVKQDLTLQDQNLRESVQNLEHEKNKIAEIVAELQQIENLSQGIRANPGDAEFYHRRGLSHQRLGDKHGAIGDYSKAIQLNSNHAGAYHQRGVLNAELGDRRQGVDDLRRAAKLYFEQGDIDSYQQARDLSKEFYEIHNPITEQAFEKINVANFLS